ncbi:sensor histidine kinase [Pseudooceanicola sp.]|uniref:sensor histidine kinase n=1 Tax=Pseudooceanicola sp. TaxID=1914328 RepID=UPI004058806B|tara:strand:+ start:45021 stop:46385 length:1365 start_codon:yes stop_codon:yes gene_type:complete
MPDAGDVDRREVLVQLIDDAPCGIVSTDPDGRIQYLNSTLRKWLGGSPEVELKRFPDFLTGAGQLFYETHMAPMMRLQGFIREISCALDRRDAEPLPVLLSGVVRRNEAGEPTRFDYTIFDASERHAYEEELRVARRNADELAAIIRSSPNAIVRVDAGGRIGSWNAGAERLTGQGLASVLNKPIQDVIRLDARSAWFDEAIRDYAGSGEVVFEAQSALGLDFEVTLTPINEYNPTQTSVNWSVVLRDITQRKRAERHLNVMVGEMKHRVNNTLAVVSGIARQSLPKEHTPRFIARLRALAQAHEALAQSGSSGAELRQVLEFSAQEAGGAERFAVHGPDIWLSPQQSASLSMAFHELVTNGLKYGALSVPEGRVDVTYEWEDAMTSQEADTARRLAITWVESGGPPVAQPTRQGFGTKMIGTVLAAELDAEVTFDYRSTGFRCEIVFAPLTPD